MKQKNNGWLIPGILFLFTTFLYIGYGVFENEKANWFSGSLSAFAALTCFYLYFQKKKQKNE